MHPRAKHLDELLRTDEPSFLNEVVHLGRAHDIEGLNVTLDAIEATQGLSAAFGIERALEFDTIDRSVAYRTAFYDALTGHDCRQSNTWNTEQRAFFRRIAPLIAGTRGPDTIRPLAGKLIAAVCDESFIDELARGTLMPIESAFELAFNSGNGLVAGRLSPLVSPELLQQATDRSASVTSGVAGGLLKTYLGSEAGRQAVRQLLSDIQRKTNDTKASRQRAALLSNYLKHSSETAQPYRMEVILDLAGVPGGRLADSFLQHAFGAQGSQWAHHRHVSAPQELARLAADSHCVPMIRMAWPLLSTMDPLKIALNSKGLPSPIAFQRTIQYLVARIAADDAEQPGAGLSVRELIKVVFSRPKPAKAAGKLSNILHLMAGMPLTTDNEDEKIRLLIEIGANPSAKNENGELAFELLPPSTGADRRARWEALSRSHSRRQQVNDLLEGLSSARPALAGIGG